MIKVRLLTEEEKALLVGRKYAKDSFFNPTLDSLDRWIISEEEIRDNQFSEFNWISQLPEIDYVPKEIDLDAMDL